MENANPIFSQIFTFPPVHLKGFLQRLDSATRRCPLLLLFVGALVGILTADRAAWPAAILIGGFFALTAGLMLRRHQLSWPNWLGAAALLLFFSLLHTREIRHNQAFPLAIALKNEQTVEISGKGWITDLTPSSSRSRSATIRLQSVVIDGHSFACRQDVPVWIQNPPESLGYGSRLDFSGLIHPFSGPRTPGGFDPANFYFRKLGALGRIEIREGDQCQLLEGNSGYLLISAAKRLRSHLEDRLQCGLQTEDREYARLIAAMTLGARENSPEDLEDWFRLSGTLHLFAVSGLHVGIIAAILLTAALWLRIPKRWAVLIVIPLILFYAVLTGLRPSAVRSAIMLSVVLASFAIKEQPRLLNSLSLAALLILFFDTQQLFLPGFQLSFAVLFSIILLSDLTRLYLEKPWISDPFIPRTLLGPWRRTKDKVVRTVAAAVAVSLVAWLGSMLPLAWHFQSLAPVGIAANLLMVPVASLVVTVAAISLASFGLHLTWLTGLLNQCNVSLAILLTSLAQFFAEIPGAHRNIGNPVATSSQRTLTLDVIGRHGEQAVLLSPQAAHGSPWMIDCGGPDTFRRYLLPLLRSRGINHLDALVLTHGDQGHLGAAPLVLSQFKPRLLLEGHAENRAMVYPDILALTSSLAIQKVALSAGQRIQLAPELQMQILAPFPDEEGRQADDRTLVCKLIHNSWSILVSSDAGFELEKKLLESGVDLNADVWVRGQHRQMPSGLAAFVASVSPRVVISTHTDFPPAESISPDLRTQLEEADATLFELNKTGVVTLEFEQERLRILPFAIPQSAIEISAKAL